MKKEMRDAPVRKADRIRSLKRIFLIIVLAVTGIFVFLHFYNNYNDKILYAERLNQMREVTTQLFSGLEDVVEGQWSSAEQQINYLQENAPQNVEELAAYMEMQSRLSDLESMQSNLIAVDSQGIFYTRTGRKGLLAEQRYLTSKPERVSFVANQLFDSHAEMVYLIQLPVPLTLEYGEKSVTITYYGIMQNMEVLNKYFKCEAYDEQNGMYVVDENGLKIFSENAEDILSGYSIYGVLEQLEYRHGTSFEQTIEELNEDGVAYSNAVLNGEEYYYVLYQMNSENWNLVFTVPSRLVATNTVALVNTSTRIILIFSITLLVICSVLIMSILTRQQRLVLEQEKENNERLAASNEKLAAALEKAERAELKAKEASRAKSEFLANMSHDIRTPMNAIMGITQLMEHDEGDPEKMNLYIHKVQNSSQHLLGLINDVLDMSKIESTEITLNSEGINLADQIAQVESIIRPQAEEHEHTFIISAHEIVHEFLIGDAVRLRQVMINLLSNAVKYTRNGGVIQFELAELPGKDREHAMLQITVTDNGYGMEPEFAEHVFEAFTRAENSMTNRVQGTGLGMAITKNIVDLMKGTITVQSEPDKGSCFTVTLPILIDKNAKYELDAKNVLLISDDESMTSNVRASFKESESSLYAVDTIESAVQMLHDQKMDIVLLEENVHNPLLQDMIKTLRKETGDSMIFCADNTSSEDSIEIVENNGLTGVIVRPFFLSKLVSAVNKVHSETEKVETEEENILKNMRFLCAEDNELNAEILDALLDMNDAACVIYPDGQKLVEAFASVKPGDYDAILMDIQMPNMNGLEAARCIRNGENPLGKSIPIIAMTANAFSSDVQECLNAGMDAHVSKPLDIGALERTLKSLRNQMVIGGGHMYAGKRRVNGIIMKE